MRVLTPRAAALLACVALIACGGAELDAPAIARVLSEPIPSPAPAQVKVPAHAVLRIETMTAAAGGLTIMTGGDATSLGGCPRG